MVPYRYGGTPMNTIEQMIHSIGIVPVITLSSPQQAQPLGEALTAGNLPIAEITFRTAAAAEAIGIMVQRFPKLLVGAGTITNVGDAERAIDAGARFIVSPGYDDEVVVYCQQNGIPVYPGVNNASQIQQAMRRGLEVVKFFPAEASGGVAMLQALGAPFPSMKFMPTGGIGLHNLAEYMCQPQIIACGGSWMVNSQLIEQGRWDEIVRLCREAVQAVHGFTFAHFGINGRDEEEAKRIVDLLSVVLTPVTEGSKSYFSSPSVEITKRPFPGTHGHIGIRTWNVERALAYLGPFGFSAVMETAVHDSLGVLQVVYLQPEAGGFAVHLLKAK